MNLTPRALGGTLTLCDDVVMTPENGTNCLVTGEAGFIGSSLTAALLAAGHEVTILDDRSSSYRKNLPAHPRLTFVEGEVRGRKAVRCAMAAHRGPLTLRLSWETSAPLTTRFTMRGSSYGGL